MKRSHVIAAILALSLSGCYNLVVVNMGVANKSASADAAPFDLEAFCSAMATAQINLSSKDTQLQQAAAQFCKTAKKGKQ